MKPIAALVVFVLILGHTSVAQADGCSSLQGCLACTNDTQCAYCPDISTCYTVSGTPPCADPVIPGQSACPEVSVDCTKHVSCTGCLSASSLGRCQWCVATQYCDAIGTTASTCDTGWTTSCNIFNKDLLIGSIIVFMGGVIGSGGGMGGGGLYLPVFLLILRLSAHVAIPLSKFTIFGVAVGGYVITHAQRHPSQDRPLIDYDTSLILEPMTLAGSIFGVYMNVIFPAYLIIVFLVVLLTFTAKRTIDKGFQLHREELEAARQLESVESATGSPIIAPTPGPAGRTPVTLGRPKARAPVGSSSRGGSRSRSPSSSSAQDDDGAMEPQDDSNDRAPLLGDDQVPNYSSNAETPNPLERTDSASSHEVIPVVSEPVAESKPKYSPEVLAQLEKDKKTPYIKIFYLWFVLGVTLIFQMLKGNGQTESVADINCGTGGFWATLLAPVPFLWFSSYLFGKQLEREYAYKISIGYPFVKGDVRWVNDPNVPWWRRPLVSFPIYSTVAGVAAGFLGIGGGMVKGPLMMEMGILSSVAVATSAYMIVFTATSTAGQFLILGRIAWEMALWYTAVGFCAAMVGQYGMVWMVKKYKKQSYVNFFLGGAIVVSVIAMVVTFGFQMKEDVASGQNLSFHGVCGKPGD